MMKENGSITHFARSLDPVDGLYHQVVLEDGKCISRDISDTHIVFTSGEYGHCVLHAVADDVSFEPLPYRPSAYPIIDIDKIKIYEHKADGKLWAIRDDYSISQSTSLTWYQNAQTDDRLVFQEVNNNAKSMQMRISEKVQKGYVCIGLGTFDSETRKLKL